jgi:hypothetical protein
MAIHVELPNYIKYIVRAHPMEGKRLFKMRGEEMSVADQEELIQFLEEALGDEKFMEGGIDKVNEVGTKFFSKKIVERLTPEQLAEVVAFLNSALKDKDENGKA